MPKPSTCTTLYDDTLQMNISKLKEWGYLEPDKIKRGTITWTTKRWGGFKEDVGSISIIVNTRNEWPYIELNYKYANKPRNYRIELVTLPSNIGNGKIWYFLCPNTNKRCRKLYSIGGYFLHREAFKGCMYDSQTKSKKWRNMEKVYGAYFDSEKCYEQLYKKHFKKFYSGKPTKRYLKLKGVIERAERIPIDDIHRLMIEGP
ncbi:hypothetical protein [Pseudozobellia sp. WGM2]|uniref:hypothetical protein n=1 Tax=Pseudozobellia sp. WGM2 TaxID=2787625 RepID=UPI001AE093CF|nr:hypothetical protein [Pseudozobellia sp. WGM2]